jgi:hypothetical protein
MNARRLSWTIALGVVAACLGLVVACGGGGSGPKPHADIKIKKNFHALPEPSLSGIHKIRHVVVIMQENRSFDSYFGTYPGADGIPGVAGNPGQVPCVPFGRVRFGRRHHRHGHRPRLHLGQRCLQPFHNRRDMNLGGPHSASSAAVDINKGLMDGFIASARRSRHNCKQNFNPACGAAIGKKPDVMGYHTGADIPNYWAYAHRFVLQDHMFESNASWSLPAHLYMVSEWSAHCTNRDPASCRPAIEHRQPARLPKDPPSPLAARLRLDRFDLPLAPLPHPLALLRAQGHRARLRAKQRRQLRAGGPGCEDARDLEPAAVLRGRSPGQSASQHPVASALLYGRAPREPARRLLDRAQRARLRAPARADQRGPDLRHRADQHDHEKPRLEVDRNLPRLGRLGRVLRPCLRW